MKNNSGFIPTDLGILGGLGLLAYGAYKVANIAKKLDLTITDLSNKTPIDIQPVIVNKAIDLAVDREVRKAVVDTSRRVGDQVRSDLKKEVQAEVKAQYADISAKVSKQVADEVAKINEVDLRQKVADRAEEIVLEKLEGSTQEAMSKLNRGLGSIVGAYEGMANVLNNRIGGGGNGIKLTLG